VYTRERKRTHRIIMVKGHLPCFLLAAAQGLVLIVQNLLEKMKRLNDNDRKQAI
jgi:hypothetical protein